MAFETLEHLEKKLKEMLSEIRAALTDSGNMSGNDADNERHYHNSKPDSHESELCQEKAKGEVSANMEPGQQEERPEPTLPLGLVLKACPDILPYSPDKIRHWHELVALAAFVRGMMGISPDAWEEAKLIMGPETAAVTVAGILQRVDHIKSPGGYLRALTRRAGEGAFSPGPMIMSLLGARKVAA